MVVYIDVDLSWTDGAEMTRTTGVLVCVLMLWGCADDGGGGGAGPDGGAAPDLSGSWKVEIVVTVDDPGAPVGTQLHKVYELDWDGEKYVGTSSATDGTSGELTVTVQGDEFSLVEDQQAPCPGTYTVMGTIGSEGEQDILTGKYIGSDCDDSIEGDFEARRL